MQQDKNLNEIQMPEDEIDETLEESFPASDPPSWSLGTNHGNQKPEANEKADSENQS